MNLKDLTTAQLTRIISIKEQIESLQAEIDSIASGGGEVPVPTIDAKPARKKYKMSPAHRRNLLKALAKARKARWAKGRGEKVADEPAAEKKAKRTMSPAARAKIAASARKRWKLAKAAGKSTL